MNEKAPPRRHRHRSHDRDDVPVARRITYSEEEEYQSKPKRSSSHRSSSQRSSSRRSSRPRGDLHAEENQLAIYHPAGPHPSLNPSAPNQHTTPAEPDKLIGVPCSEHCVDHPSRKAGLAEHKSFDDPGYDSDEEYHLRQQQKKELRNKTILATGLSCVTTIAVGNGVYQAHKAHRIRREAMEAGPMCSAEAQRQKEEHSKRNMIAAGLVVVAAYNMRNAWRRTLNQREEYHEALEKWREDDKRRERKEMERFRLGEGGYDVEEVYER